MRRILCLLGFLSVTALHAQVTTYPSNWWAGMKWNKVQVLLHGNNIGSYKWSVKYPGVSQTRMHKFANNNYVAIDLTVAPMAKPGVIKLVSTNKNITASFPLYKKRRGNGTGYAQGVTSADLMYLVMPDRFSNGDPGNDRITGMKDQTLRRDTVYNRHGGDFKGIQNHLDYLKDLGVTALWLNPVQINDMPERTEHGYAITDHYTIEPRLGSEAGYTSLIDSAHAKGLKIIQDAVYNHVGIEHILFKDMPDSTWFHRWPAFVQTSYRDQVAFDPHASLSDRKKFSDGWFTEEMPDWNQSNSFVQNFLIQHALWSVEKFGIDGWRIDTYAYNDLEFMNRCNKALYDEYPRISIFGETWVHGVLNQAYFTENNLNIPYKSNLQATTDFQTLFYGIQPALLEKFGWTDGVSKLYTTASHDFIYKEPMRQVIFLDNHDLPRFWSVIKEDKTKYITALKWLLTFRGIPQLYYGDEILMTGLTTPNDGFVRQDFPGGWPGDASNKFEASGRTDPENEIFNLIRSLAQFRKTSDALRFGNLIQFLPDNGLYVYFRYTKDQTILCALNTDDKPRTISLRDYSERTANFQTGIDVITRQNMGSQFTVPPYEMTVLELK